VHDAVRPSLKSQLDWIQVDQPSLKSQAAVPLLFGLIRASIVMLTQPAECLSTS
jgi:hypothetical protein